MASQVLYRFWNAEDVLLYVGITARPWERWKQHRGEKPWWDEVVKVTIENFETRAEVKAAETTAIKTEGPLYNIAERPWKPDAEPVEEWDGRHVLWVSNYSSSLVYCSCRPVDETDCPDPIADFHPWADAQPYIRAGDYADHVIESVAAERWAEAMDAARTGIKAEVGRRKRSAKFVLEVWPEGCHKYLPRQWQRYVREYLDEGLTRDDIREAMAVALDAHHIPPERMWKYATGVLANKKRKLVEAAEAYLAKGGA